MTAKDLAHIEKVAEGAMHCTLYCTDGYTTNVRIDRFSADDVILAHSWSGTPPADVHSGPERVVLPQWYFWKSVKWIRRIEFVSADIPGFYETRGYHIDGDPCNEGWYRE